MRQAGVTDRQSGRLAVPGDGVGDGGVRLARRRRKRDVQFERVLRRRGRGEGMGRVVQSGADGVDVLCEGKTKEGGWVS